MQDAWSVVATERSEMIDSLWGSKRRHNEYDIVDNPVNTTQDNDHRSLKSYISSLYVGDTWNGIFHHFLVLMMDPLWGSKCRYDEYDIVDNLVNTTQNNDLLKPQKSLQQHQG